MKPTISRFVMTVEMPILFAIGVYLFFQDAAPISWLPALPLLLVVTFMSTLAEIHDEGQTILVKRWWSSLRVIKTEIAIVGPSFLEGIRVLQLRRFVFPWGRIYFVAEWSSLGTLSAGAGEEITSRKDEPYSLIPATLASFLAGISGFIAARTISSDVQDFRIETFTPRVAAVAIAGALCVVFAIIRTRRPSFANVVLFLATWIAGLVRS